MLDLSPPPPRIIDKYLIFNTFTVNKDVTPVELEAGVFGLMLFLQVPA
jgi:hypothetical protein